MGDAGVVLRAAQSDRRAFQFADQCLFSDREFILKAVRLEARVLLKASAEIRLDKLFMFECVKVNYQAANFASPELKKLLDSFAEADKERLKGNAAKRSQTEPARRQHAGLSRRR